MTAIDWERRLLAQQGLEIRQRHIWGAVQGYGSDRDCEVPATAFFLHIAVVDDPGDLLGTEDQVARNIEAIGQSRFGSGMSYNALAFNTGRLYEAQPLTRRGTHTVNTFERTHCPTHPGSLTAPGWNNNVNARALCLPQQVDDPVTDAQIDAAARWAAVQIRAGLAAPWARWHGHRCVTAKDCPGGRAFDRINELQALTEHYVKNGLEDIVTKDEMNQVADMVVDKLLAAEVGEDRTVKAALRMASKAPAAARDLQRTLTEKIQSALLSEPGDVAVTVTAEQIEEAVKAALREGTGA
ncbi:peptidoglycan recognition protein family protein [Nocardioides sp.]|uniref:peptidoglycan recognition protein family protein n=1 Tax=Nocardioides sp. TaxID=35761 RepID=UPI002B89B33A|nr:N-acetylmuramoyl-L-alanine amidase [Nocardioides sp.]HXH77330.1 N-acetylmuramoyl-L-alanine amidase [Nocardioides sp.]